MNPSPKLTDQENRSTATFLGYSSQDKSIENNTKRILNHVLKNWNKNNSSAKLIMYWIVMKNKSSELTRQD